VSGLLVEGFGEQQPVNMFFNDFKFQELYFGEKVLMAKKLPSSESAPTI
jgi:hypothetical protein